MTDPTPFQSWLDLCTLRDDVEPAVDGRPSRSGGDDEASSRLVRDARSHFESLSSSSPSSSSSSSPSASSAATSPTTTPDGALALLVSTLKPALSSSSIATTHRLDATVRALRCLTGASEGCATLTRIVRDEACRTALELCGVLVTEENDGDDDADEDAKEDEPMMDFVDGTGLTPEEVTQKLEAMDRADEERKRRIEASSYGKDGADGSSRFVRDDARDSAMGCLNALLRTRLDILPTQQQSSDVAVRIAALCRSMESRLELAVSGVRRRCGTDTSDDEFRGGAGDGYDATNHSDEFNVEDGLSQLPRSKRSLCFDLLEGALDGFAEDYESMRETRRSQPHPNDLALPPSLANSMSAFASLTSSCMHGETDPRCLLQLLRLLNKVQRAMLPLFAEIAAEKMDIDAAKMDIDATDGEGGAETTAFPFVEVFDAVAPYYPVQFAPPKNDPHGITREKLQDALMAVLCERGAVYPTTTRLVKGGKRHEGGGEEAEEEDETAISLAARMFLERLEPPKSSEYDPPSDGGGSDVEDKIDAVRDLSSLLLGAGSSNAARLAPAFFSELSSSTARVHEEAVSSSADAHSLAGAVRKFSSSLARHLEPVATVANGKKNATNAGDDAVDTTPLWEAFVIDVVRRLSPALGSAPQGTHGRASTAYLASLAAEGGLSTLDRVLEGCYPRFLGILSPLEGKDEIEKDDDANKDMDVDDDAGKRKASRDEEKMAAAMRGVAALVSSCRVATRTWQGENPGARVHPHPLAPYVPSTIRKIASVLLEDREGDGVVGPLSTAAATALESVATSADLGGLAEGDAVALERAFSSVARVVLEEEEATGGEDVKDRAEWKATCARVLGAAVAVGLSREKESNNGEDNDGNVSTMENGPERMEAMAASLLPELLASATLTSKNGSGRLARTVLAGACADGGDRTCRRIVSALVSDVVAALSGSNTTYGRGEGDPRGPAAALAHLVRRGGPNVGAAFHGLSSPGPTPFDIVNELSEPSRRDAKDDNTLVTGQLQVGMSLLQLPASRAKEEEAADDAIERANLILPYLVPAYECPSAASSCGSLARFVDQILPPLSQWDEVKLSVAFPLLAAVLNGLNDEAWRTLDGDASKTLRSMVSYLAQYSIGAEHDARARSAAASCLFSVLLHECLDDDGDGDVHLFRELLEEVVYPALADSITCLKEELSDTDTPDTPESLRSSLLRFEETISFTAVLGSAAACKGGPFSQTADKIASFLIELACAGVSQFPFTETTLQLVALKDQGQTHPLMDPASHSYIMPASAFGGMLSVQNGGPFWRQRTTHKTFPVLLKALQAQARSHNPPSLGSLAVVCHMICCLPASIVGKSNIQQILPTAVAGLVYFSKNLKALTQSEMISSKATDVLSIILAALTKILSISPEFITKFIGIIIPSLLLLSSSTELSEAYIPKQLLVLQCLETIATLPQSRNAILREKDQVVAILSAVADHPSMIIRNAVAQVRNVWYTLA